MQILKEEIHDKILAEAEMLFFARGFKDTTTREIAARTGISVSNLYKYFKNKEDIFSRIVHEFHHKILQELSVIFSVKHKNHDKIIIQQATKQLVSIILSNRSRFIILLQKSQGTRYADFKDRIIRMFTAHMKSEVDPAKLPNSFMLEVIARNFFAGFTHILEADNKSSDFYRENITVLLKFHLKGMSQFK